MVQQEQVRTTGGNVRHRLMFPAWCDHMAISAGRAPALRHYRRGWRRSTKTLPAGAQEVPMAALLASLGIALLLLLSMGPRRGGRRSVPITDRTCPRVLARPAAGHGADRRRRGNADPRYRSRGDGADRRRRRPARAEAPL